MNVRPQLAESGRSKALSVSLNQDNSCFAVGIDTGFYSMHPLLGIEPSTADKVQYIIQTHAPGKKRRVRNYHIHTAGSCARVLIGDYGQILRLA